MKVGLLAGRGALPEAITSRLSSNNIDFYIAQLAGDFDPALDGDYYHIGQFGKIVRNFRSKHVTHICLAGYVDHPNFWKMRPDIQTLRHLPAVLGALKKGDDALLRYVLKAFEGEGFEIISAQEICRDLLANEGVIGSVSPPDACDDDVCLAVKAAREVGANGIGQGAVVRAGGIIAKEGRRGTDDMLKELIEKKDGAPETRKDRNGVLAKFLKPGQEDRVDLPTIGLQTVELVDQAGLAGIILHAENAFLLDREELIADANARGIFILGCYPEDE